MSVCCECCVLSNRGFCDELITRPEESYRLWRVVICDLKNLVSEKALAHWPWGGGDCRAKNKQMRPELDLPAKNKFSMHKFVQF